MELFYIKKYRIGRFCINFPKKIIFKKMNYQKIYDSIIEKANSENRRKGDGIYYEKHHIIPRCLNGGDEKENLVLLTAREHFLCHKLLAFIYPNKKEIFYAIHLMTFMNKEKYALSSRDYEYAKLKLLEFPPFLNKQHTSESKDKISNGLKSAFGEGRRIQWNKNKKGLCPQLASMKGKHHSLESKKKISEAFTGEKNPFYGKKHKEETKIKMRESGKKRDNSSYRSAEFISKKKILAKGENNPMFKKSLLERWKEKYGEEEAKVKYIKWIDNLKKAKNKK
jgi:hypothetical protein